MTKATRRQRESLPEREEITRAREEISEHATERESHIEVTVREVVTEMAEAMTDAPPSADAMTDVVDLTETTEVSPEETMMTDHASTVMTEEMIDVPLVDVTIEDPSIVMIEEMVTDHASEMTIEETTDVPSVVMTDVMADSEEKVATETSREETDALTTKRKDAITQA